jgi:hypothetical protein
VVPGGEEPPEREADEDQRQVAHHGGPDELASVWAPFEARREQQSSEFAGLKPEIGQVMGAVWQILTTGTEKQRRDAVEILVETRRKLYGLLADGDESDDADPEDEQP